jgi:drug/metabolite transporter (DMT)-like permease
MHSASKILIALYVVATSLALIVLKFGTKAGPPAYFVDGKLQFNINLYTVSGVACYGLSFLLYIYLISKYDLGFIIPLTTALVYILIFIASFVVFSEPFTFMKVAGIALIVLGLALLNLGNR